MNRTNLNLRICSPELLLAFSCFFALAADGCGHGLKGVQAKHSTVTVLVCCGEWSPVSPDEDEPAKFLVFLPLVARNAKGELEGRLAQSWEHSPDYRTWTIHLRKGVHWQDGVPVTARDIKFTLELLSNPQSCVLFPPDAVTVKILDDYTYTLTYSKDAGRSAFWNGSNPLDDWTVYYPKHLLEKLDQKNCAAWEFWRQPIGDGPYRHVRTVAQTMMEFEADPNYYRGRPKIEYVVLKFFPGGHLSGPMPLTELLSGNVDAISGAVPKDVMKLSGNSRFRTYFWMSPLEGAALFWNERYPTFRDPKVRRALTLAINRRELNDTLNLPKEAPIADVLFTPRQFPRGELPGALPYDPKKANRLLDEAGWHYINNTGVRERAGHQFRFTTLAATLGASDQALIYVQAALRHVGVEMEIERLDYGVLRDRARAGNFQAVVDGVLFGGNWPQLLYFQKDSPIGYSNPKVIALLQKTAATMDPDEYDRIYRELWPVFETDMPATFLYFVDSATVTDRRVKGLSTPWRSDPVQYMEDLWLEDGGKR